MAQRVKDPALPLQQQLRSLLRHGFDHWPRNIHMPWVPPPSGLTLKSWGWSGLIFNWK